MSDLPTAVVTGATGGMGGAIVRDLSRTHRVIAIGRSVTALERLTAETECETVQLDITDYAAASKVAGGLERLEVLVHAAAISTPLPVADATPADWEEQFATNVIAPAHLTRELLPLLRASAGTVVFIGSGAGTRPVPRSAVYAASKHALKAVADVLRIDEEPHRIRVVTVAPGQTDTGMLRASLAARGGTYEPERYIRPESVAAAVRQVVDATPDVQITDIAVRPRQEITRL